MPWRYVRWLGWNCLGSPGGSLSFGRPPGAAARPIAGQASSYDLTATKPINLTPRKWRRRSRPVFDAALSRSKLGSRI